MRGLSLGLRLSSSKRDCNAATTAPDSIVVVVVNNNIAPDMIVRCEIVNNLAYLNLKRSYSCPHYTQ